MAKIKTLAVSEQTHKSVMIRLLNDDDCDTVDDFIRKLLGLNKV